MRPWRTVRPLLLALVLSGCATARVTERFTIDAPAAELRASAEEAAQKLGWATEAVDAQSFRVTDYARQHWLMKKPLLVTIADGALAVEGEREGWADVPVESARLLASATKQVRGELVFSPRVEERSEAVTVALDVLFPAGGALYALKDDPAFDSPVVYGMRKFWWEFWGRVALDGCAVALGAEFALLRRPDGTSVFPAWYIGMPIATLLAARIGALITDLTELPFRNAYARSGLRAPKD